MLRKTLLALILLLLIDGVWLTGLASNLYVQSLAKVLRIDENGLLQADALFGGVVYLLLVAGIVIFPIRQSNDCAKSAALLGFLFGIIVYGIYDFTNMALLSHWPINIALIDTLWGGTLCSATAAGSIFLAKKISVKSKVWP